MAGNGRSRVVFQVKGSRIAGDQGWGSLEDVVNPGLEAQLCLGFLTCKVGIIMGVNSRM